MIVVARRFGRNWNNMRYITPIIILLISNNLLGQTGPAGVGNNEGTSDLKLWLRAENGISASGNLIDGWTNSAGVSALDISETGSQRPTLVTNAVNGYNEVSFNGANRLRTGLTLTSSNFITDQASSFTVCRADNTTQRSCVYTTDPLVDANRFTNHIPWANTVYFDIGTCCANDTRLQVGGLSNLNSYSIWTYDASPTLGKQLYRNGTLLQSRPNTATYAGHSTQRFNIGGNTSGSEGFVGDVAEIIIYNQRINSAQRIIIDNYLGAKYGLSLTANDTYDNDNSGEGNYDHDVAGIGRVDASNMHDDAQGTGIVRISNPSDLDDNEFFMWGHDNGIQQAINTTDVPIGVKNRLDRVWRVSERTATNSADVNVGTVDMRWDLNALGTVNASELALLIDDNNNGLFNDDTPILGAIDLGNGIFEFQNIPDGSGGLQNNSRFTLGTLDSNQTPLPIELLNFTAEPINDRYVLLEWQTASESNNDYFTIEKSKDAINWQEFDQIQGAGNSTTTLQYQTTDQRPFFGVTYYRLKQTDFNGKFEYAGIRSVHFNTSQSALDIYPNPSQNLITIQSTAQELSSLKIYSALGQDITEQCGQLPKSEGVIVIDLSHLPAGIYTVKTLNNAEKVFKE